MGAFDGIKDSPLRNIRAEGQTIAIKIEKTSPTTARISWSLPHPFAGCRIDDLVYNGIVVTLDTSPISIQKAPKDGIAYTADPTADTNLHAGDKLSSAMVVFAAYNDKTTTFVDITGLSSNVAYYASGFAVDNVLRYHTEGVHSYSLPYGKLTEDSTHGRQDVTIGVQSTDPTGLLIGTMYSFMTNVDRVQYTVPVDGTYSQTYDELVQQLNKQLSLLGSPPISSGYPNVGSYYYNTLAKALYQWDGQTHNSIPVINWDTDPTTMPTGSYWYNNITDVLYKQNAGWQSTTVINFSKDPTLPSCDDFWFTGTAVNRWSGTIWTPYVLLNHTIDPSLSPVMECPSYWYDENGLVLNRWNEDTVGWENIDRVVQSIVDPSVLSVGQFWFNHDTTILNKWDGLTWQPQVVTISETTPAYPQLPNTLWFKNSTEELFMWTGSVWALQVCLVTVVDVSDIQIEDAWWKTSTDELFVWSGTAWALATPFVLSTIDPSAARVMTTKDVWYNPTDKKMYLWIGSWKEISYINYATDPRFPTAGHVNKRGEVWYVWAGTFWAPISPLSWGSDPMLSPAGTFWYQPSTSTLRQWSGVAWTSILYSNTPLTPATNFVFYDTLINTLQKWTGTYWETISAKAMVELMSDGNLRFASSSTGSLSHIQVVDVDLFKNLTPKALIKVSTIKDGADGRSGTSTYSEVGIGTDGSPDERRKMVDDIRLSLGWPVVQVELTDAHYDYAINQALSAIRKFASSPYKRVYFFMDIQRGTNKYILSNKNTGFNKIVDITALYRVHSSLFAGAAYEGAYGQALIQHLYQQGTYDLLSWHMYHTYIETLNNLFANDLQFDWHEETRELFIYQTVVQKERILVDAMVERTEQELMRDRFLGQWIFKYAAAMAKRVLAGIRGKYGSLPGAGGGVSLNASDLIQEAQNDIDECMKQIAEYVVEKPEEVGMVSTFIMG